MSLAVWGGFAGGVIVALWAAPVFDWLKDRVRRHRTAKTLADNRVSTVSQVLHLAVQGAPSGITVVEKSGDVILSNSRAHDMGIVHERAVNKDVWAKVLEVYEDSETRSLDLPAPPRRAGSRVTAVRAVIKPLTLVDPRFVIIYSTDESENMRMESARRDFVANVSHELKTPVGGMALLAEALIESADDPDSVQYFGSKLTSEAHRLADMINELIALSKLQGAEALPDMEPVSVDDVIDEAINRNHVAAEGAGITLTRDEPTGVEVMGDETLLATAVANLVSNAINYSPSETTVSLTQQITPGESVKIRVTDRGIGIAPEHQQRLFERFFRVDKARSRSTGGTGLGLAIVKHVAANHGGEITVWSVPGTGSTFTLTLPIAPPEPAPVPAGELAQPLTIPASRARSARRKER